MLTRERRFGVREVGAIYVPIYQYVADVACSVDLRGVIDSGGAPPPYRVLYRREIGEKWSTFLKRRG